MSRVRYVTQASSRPPAFVAFVSGTQPFTEASTKFLGNALRQEFGFDGVPLRMNVRIRKAEKVTLASWGIGGEGYGAMLAETRFGQLLFHEARQ